MAHQGSWSAGDEPVADVLVVPSDRVVPVELIADLDVVAVLGEAEELQPTDHPVARVPVLVGRGVDLLVEVLVPIPREELGQVSVASTRLVKTLPVCRSTNHSWSR